MGGYKIASLSIKKSDWDVRKELENTENLDKVEKGEMTILKNRVINRVKVLQATNPKSFSCRKRAVAATDEDMENAEVSKGLITPLSSKRRKSTGISQNIITACGR